VRVDDIHAADADGPQSPTFFDDDRRIFVHADTEVFRIMGEGSE
jgi:hypothetical protein